MATVPCDACGAPLARTGKRLAARHFFCNPQCKGAWQTGRYSVDKAAYRSAYRVIKRGGKSVKEHRWLVEQASGRTLRRDEHVHHSNRDKLDNGPENLGVLECGEHVALHHRLSLDVERIVALRADGLTITAIAEQMGVSRKAVACRLRERGVDASERFVGWDVEKALELLAEGMSRERVAATLGISRNALCKRLRRLRVECADARNKIAYDFGRIDALRAAGRSVRSIALEIGASYGGLRKALIRTGRFE